MHFEHFFQGTFVLLYITDSSNFLLQLPILFKHPGHLSHGILYLHLPSCCFSHRPLLLQQCCHGHAHQPLDRKSTRLNSSHTVIYTLSLHDALPIWPSLSWNPLPSPSKLLLLASPPAAAAVLSRPCPSTPRSEEHTSELQSHSDLHSFPTRRSSDLAISLMESSTFTFQAAASRIAPCCCSSAVTAMPINPSTRSRRSRSQCGHLGK